MSVGNLGKSVSAYPDIAMLSGRRIDVSVIAFNEQSPISERVCVPYGESTSKHLITD